jgi:hypothetical protein
VLKLEIVSWRYQFCRLSLVLQEQLSEALHRGLLLGSLKRLSHASSCWTQKKVPRHELYKEFIEAATYCYADALQHEEPDIPALVKLYGKIGRMRVLASPKVLGSAEQIGQKIINMYLEPNKSFFELREMVNKNAVDIIGNFGEACREEFRSM